MNDRRSRRTRLAIYHALQSLMAEKNYERITVQEIIRRADIGRSTFYHHFQTRDEVLRALCADIFTHVFEPEASPIRDAAPAPSATLRDKLIHTLSHLSDRELHLSSLLRSDEEGIFLHYFRKYAASILRSYIRAESSGIPEELLLTSCASSLADMLRWWLSGHEEYSACEIADFYLAAHPQDLFRDTPAAV